MRIFKNVANGCAKRKNVTKQKSFEKIFPDLQQEFADGHLDFDQVSLSIESERSKKRRVRSYHSDPIE